VRQNLKINGTLTPEIKVVCVESGKTGKATVVIDGTEKQIPSSLPVELHAKINVVKEYFRDRLASTLGTRISLPLRGAEDASSFGTTGAMRQEAHQPRARLS
jgi:hypothetical protein